MSSFEHHATVDNKGLKMKIKRKNVNVDKTEKQKKDISTKSDLKSDSCKDQTETTGQSANGMFTEKAGKLSLFSDKEKSPKSKSSANKKDKSKGTTKGELSTQGPSSLNGIDNSFNQSAKSMEPKLGETAMGKKDCMPDPYEFNAKVEDDISMPIKKMKVDKEKVEMASSHMSVTPGTSQDASTSTRDAAVVTDPDCLGPCEPGTNVTLEGIVWHESENGVLVVNVTWRGKTYVGTLLDATRHDWAPPRFNNESPTSELESRTPKGRGKRRGAANTPVQDTRTLRKGRRGSSAQTFTAPPSPAKSESSVGGLKRKGRPQDIDLSVAEQRSSKRSRSGSQAPGSQAPTPNAETPPTDANGYIECPEPNCNKKYKNINGLKYHQSHAHSGNGAPTEDAKEDMECEDIPLSVVKNSVKKEKEFKKESNSKKDKDKSDSNDRKTDKSDQASNKKSDKEDNVQGNDTKDSGNKNDSKSDNTSVSKKKDKESSKGSKTQNENAANKAQSNGPKSSGNSSNTNSGLPVSSQPSPNSVQNVASQSSPLSSSQSSAALTQSSSLNAIATVSQGDTNTVTSKPLVDIKPKITIDSGRVSKPNRPIVPAPPHTVLSNVQVTHSSLTPVMSHTQMSPQLKPIQPKPTIMGEPQNVNPALVDLNKDRKKSQKKKTKDGNNGQNGAQSRPEQPTIKIDRTGVIKPNPMPIKGQTEQQRKDLSKDGSRPIDAHRSHNMTTHGHKLGDMHARQSQNPNLLKVNSPLQVNTPDKVPVSDDVQSPAYSDISDANESASPVAPSDTSPQKQKEDVAPSKKEEKAKQPILNTTEGQMTPHYGMYNCYGQSPYGMNNMSPGQKVPNSQSNTPSSAPQHVSQRLDQSKAPKLTPNKEKQPEDSGKGERKVDGDKDGNRPKGPAPPPQHMSGPPPGNMTPQQMHEYQMMYQQNLMYIQSLPQHVQYQYMANGWYPQPMDQNYMRMMEEQRRVQGDQSRSERDGTPSAGKGQGPEREQSRGPEGAKAQNIGPGGRKDEGLNIPKPMISPNQGNVQERNDSAKSSDDKKKDQALREKQNENHQILKENIDIKNEMDKRQDYERIRAEEMRRHKMYQEQKMIEERKKMDLARKGEGSRPENLTTKAPGTKPIVDNTRNVLNSCRPGSDMKKDSTVSRDINNTDKVKDSRDSRDSSSGKYSDNRQTDEKSRTPVPDKHRSETPTRNPEMKRPGGSSSKSGSPCSSVGSSSIPGSPNYSPYSSYQYMQNPHGYMGMDPMYRNHNVNPALIGNFPGNQYIHPSQMGYRPGEGDEKEGKERIVQKPGPPLSESDVKKGGSDNGPYYSNMHKIHELSEKGRPKSRNSSPGPIKSVAGDVTTSVYDKHRDFTNSPPTQRHVHTHHHTHVLQPGPGLQTGAPLQGPPGFSPVYDPYSAMFVGQAQSPHHYPPK
ncbi:zinc finger protein 608-like isoform X1 [Mya arenaria]|uniref:zinc finger protein 608-like isoform X1 n=2 Tax=Mya arenaria TaxID=6604 RepID=UPI0022E23DA3|nr:zinc finger protein 608-like isoform X1 [Mya arenaria]